MENGCVGVSLRSFKGEPLSVNRLRHNEATNDVILRRPLMEPSTSSEFCEQLPPTSLDGGYNQYAQRFSDCTETYPAPPSEFHAVAVDEENGNEQTIISIRGDVRNSNGNSDETDVDDEIAASFSKKSISYLVPSKSQVLSYMSRSSKFKIHQTGCELQVTDSTDFPLLDVWAEAVCCSSPVWIVESYGRRVLVLSERRPVSFTSFLPPFLSSVLGGRRRGGCALSVVDWNGDLIGFFIPGDPFIIQNNVRSTIARCTPTEQTAGNWQCVLESSGREIARMEDSHVSFSSDISFQLKLLILTALARAVGRPRPNTNCFPFLR